MNLPEFGVEKKVLLMGLDKSGKTSILLSLLGNRNLLSYYALEPTRGLEVKKILLANTNFNMWELGGQEGVREENLQDFEQYAMETDKIFYIIDVQDEARYDLTINYFQLLVQKLINLEIYPEITLFLHKFDLELEKDPKYSMDQIRKKLISKIEIIVDKRFPLKVCKTTIFTTFQKKWI
jgi:GTPase SAR1 family protein